METKNQKLMINWEQKKVIGIKHHRGSPAYKALIDKGYIEVGQIKENLGLFIQSEFFDFNDKYTNGSPNIDTITT